MASINYFSIYNPLTDLGVNQKISQTLAAFQKLGFSTKTFSLSPTLRGAEFMLAFQLMRSRSDIVILRSVPAWMALYFFPLCLQRVRGAKVVIEAPSPNRTVIREILLNKTLSYQGRLLRIILIYLGNPLSLFPANLVLQYADEHPAFLIGVKNRTRFIANGIDVESTKERTRENTRTDQAFKILGVAHLAKWHGFDRVIAGMRLLNQEGDWRVIKPIFYIVGEGPAKQELHQLAVGAGLADSVIFCGPLSGSALDDIFDHCDIAISSIGLSRKGLSCSSSLKSREYTARGIPFVMTGSDIDFNPPPNFVLTVENDDTPLDISRLFYWHKEIQSIEPKEIREYALRELSLQRKMSDIVRWLG